MILDMLIVTARELNTVQKHEIQAILDACERHEKTSLTYPLDEEDTLHIIGYDADGSPVAVIGMYHISEYSYEAVAFTIPERRREGCFKALLQRASRLVYALHHRTVTVTWVTDETGTTAGRVARHIKAKRKSIELHMSIRMDNAYYEQHLMDLPAGEFRFVPVTPTRLLYRVSQAGRVLAFFSLLNYDSRRETYMYAFEVEKMLRGHGIGTRIFRHILRHVYEQGYTTLSLQVSQSNKAACRMYKNAGLCEDTRLGYYVMKLN